MSELHNEENSGVFEGQVKCMKNLKEDDIVISWGVNGEEE
jgi:hypothetical protein